MPQSEIDRRHLLKGAVVAAAITPFAAAQGAEGKTVANGRINQSLVFWCFNATGDKWDIETTCKNAVALGLKSVELCGPEHWPTLKKHGLTCAIAPNGMPGAPFMKGFNNPRYHDEVITVTKKMIDACAEAGVPAVIGFTGFKWKDADDAKSGEISREEGEKNCIKGLKDIAGYAEQKKITICIEHLNTRQLAPHERASRLPGRRSRLPVRHPAPGCIATRKTAVRHIPCANHARRHHPAH